MGSIGFIVTTLCVTAGIAGAPWLLPRCTTTLGVYEARKSLGWAIFFAGIVIITRPDGTQVTLDQIATVRDGFADVDVRSRFDGQPAAVAGARLKALFRQHFSHLASFCDSTFEVGYEMLWQGVPEE